MRFYHIHFKDASQAQDFCDQLEAQGCPAAYVVEQEEEVLVALAEPFSIKFEELVEIVGKAGRIETIDWDAIDWEEEWKKHAVGFEGGVLVLEVPGSDKTVQLLPGAGFGDLSHATTRMMLMAMSPVVKGKKVIDIGCGSGVLLTAALAGGAEEGIGIDIDPGAVEHTQRNLELNGFENRARVYLTEDFWNPYESDIIVLMNMIQSEQRQAWRSVRIDSGIVEKMITSGVRKEEAEKYLQTMALDGWQLEERLDEDGWCCFLLRCR